MLVIRRVHVNYRLAGEGTDAEVVERVHTVHADSCPVYRTLKDAFEITTAYELV